MKAIAFCGPHNSGKTTLIRKVVNELSLKGYKVGVIKSTKHSGLFRETGKDTTIFLESFAQEVGLVSSSESVVFYKRKLDIQDLFSLFSCEFLILEGFRRTSLPKIAVFRNYEENYWKGINNITAVVTKKEQETLCPWDVPKFSFDDVKRIAKFLEESSFEQKAVNLWVNGKCIDMKPFVESLLRDMILGFVKNLKGVDFPKNVKIEITI